MIARRTRLVACAGALFSLTLLGPGNTPVNSETETAARPLPELVQGIKIPKLKIETPAHGAKRLPSGATLLTAPDDSLPFLTLEISFPGGTNAEPVKAAGTLEAMTRLMEIGGAGERDGDEIAEALSRLGARINVGHGYESWSISMTILKDDFAAGFQLMNDILLRPRFPAERLPVIQNGMITRIKQRNDEPANIARRKLMEILYGDLRAGYYLQMSDVKRLSIESIKAEYKRRLSSRGVIIAASGDLKGLQIEDGCNALLAQLSESSKLQIETTSRTSNPYSGKILHIERPAAQAVIMTGTYLPPHNDPDFFGMQTGNYILGEGSFNSRLMREIRARRGLAYYAYSATRFRAGGGTFFAGSGTRIDAAAETLRLMLKMIGDMPRNVSEAELDLAREAILNSLVFQYEDPAKFLASEVRFRRHKMPPNYLKVFADRVRTMTTTEIKRVFRRHLRPNEMSIVVVGPASLKSELSKIRPVVTVDPEDVDFRDRLK